MVAGASITVLTGVPPDIAKLMDLAEKARNATAKVPTLDPSDAEMEPDYDPPGMPNLPISCGGDETEFDTSGCEKCYRQAHEKLKKLRRNFEQLRALFVETDEFTKASIAFGDGVAGLTGVAALEWHHQRTNIMSSFKGFTEAYKRKCDELLADLDKALHQIGDCEAEYFGDADWYNRYGFMFHGFMAMHYVR